MYFWKKNFVLSKKNCFIKLFFGKKNKLWAGSTRFFTKKWLSRMKLKLQTNLWGILGQFWRVRAKLGWAVWTHFFWKHIIWVILQKFQNKSEWCSSTRNLVNLLGEFENNVDNSYPEKLCPQRPVARSATSPTQQCPCGCQLAKANLKWFFLAKNTRAKTADFRVWVCTMMTKSWIFFFTPLRTHLSAVALPQNLTL